MRNRNRSAFFALTVALTCASTFSLNCQPIADPSPARLRAAVNENLIILTWIDSSKTNGDYVIYRADQPIDATIFPAATRLGEIASGVQTYSYSPPDSKLYYYAVFAVAQDGSPFRVFIPNQNLTTTGIAAGKAVTAIPVTPPASSQPNPTVPAPLPSTASASLPLPYVSGISAKAKGDAIIISYKASPKSRLVVYRGTSPISGAADLLDATLVAAFTDKDGTFADYPVPGVDYYYAILGEEDLKAGNIGISVGGNSLAAPTQIKASSSTALSGASVQQVSPRTPPLPYFLLEDGAYGEALTEEEGLVPALPVSPETEKAISSILLTAPVLKPVMPPTRVLPEELASPSGGEDYALSLIVSDRIAAKDWAGAAEQLRKYLSLNRGPKATARAHFYLGEALAFTDSTREAFFEFLSAREFYPTETKPWIEYVLAILRDSV